MATEYGLADLWGMVRLLRIAPVSREMILNFVAQQSLGLPEVVLMAAPVAATTRGQRTRASNCSMRPPTSSPSVGSTPSASPISAPPRV